MSAINIDKNNFQSEVMNSNKPVLLDFWAPWWSLSYGSSCCGGDCKGASGHQSR